MIAQTTRTVDDNGPGASNLGKWLDVYIPYVAKTDQQRIVDFNSMTWRDIISYIGTKSSLRCYAN